VVPLAASTLGFKERKVDPCLCSNPYLFLEGSNSGSATFNFQQTTQQPDEFDICWFDLAITPDVLYKIKPYQRVSQWPGIQIIAHKNKLGQNLMMMHKEYPEAYDFFPATYILPYELTLFKK